MNMDANAVAATMAVAAFVMSVYSTAMTVRFNRRQEELIKSQKALNELQQERERSELSAASKADVGANFVSLGSNNHRLRVFNRGAHPARDVRITFPEGNEVVLTRDIEQKFPMASLDRHQSVDLIAAFHMGSPSKLVVELTWTDGNGERRSKILHVTR
jgi:hypothetical protein